MGMDIKKLLKELEIVLAHEEEYKELLAQRGDDAEDLLDLLQTLSGYPDVKPPLRSAICKAMLRLSKRSSVFPKCLLIQNVNTLGKHPVVAGGFGDIWKGMIGESTQTVCLKIVRVYLKSDIESLVREFVCEAIIWKQLEHPNLLPFLGLYFLDDTRICLISPWMDNGNLNQYLQAKPRDQVDHYLLVCDVASGLAYLHRMKIIHADLKGVNVLITAAERACIADFGLSRIVDSADLCKITSSTTTNGKGTTRWMAPELLKPSPASPSYESDVYAFACVCYEIYTGLLPFHLVRNDVAVMQDIIQGNRPLRPDNATIELNDTMWSLIERCWAAEPSIRPTAEMVRRELGDVAGSELSSAPESMAAPDCNPNITTSIWTNLEHKDIPLTAWQFLSECIEKIHQRNAQEKVKQLIAKHKEEVAEMQAEINELKNRRQEIQRKQESWENEIAKLVKDLDAEKKARLEFEKEVERERDANQREWAKLLYNLDIQRNEVDSPTVKHELELAVLRAEMNALKNVPLSSNVIMENTRTHHNSNPDDSVTIFVMGSSHSGKSSFIRSISGDRPVETIQSGTMERVDFTDSRSGRNVTIVDMPGFDSSSYPYTLKKITDFLLEEYDAHRKLNGLVYFQRISEPRFSGQDEINLRMFQKLCGTDTYKNTIVLTTFLDKVSEHEGEERERQMHNNFFKELVEGGALLMQHTQDYAVTAQSVIDQIFTFEFPVDVQITKEIREEGKKFEDTAAGSMREEMDILAAKHNADLAAVQAEINELGSGSERVQELEWDRANIRKIIQEIETAKMLWRLLDSDLSAPRAHTWPMDYNQAEGSIEKKDTKDNFKQILSRKMGFRFAVRAVEGAKRIVLQSIFI
ncbi:hypothetical protein BDP27DRAFT_1299590 [Rhodocollybia butyracea]|uniref:Protein kinase domain-containing protein n=1 Tax=Rhodocollybia butyracea TaxID=206335 RepID=A0A9P5U2G9_9AGAR|nr:hypothetical protein BDP27DRAFT_1299590 [Rhodocollybia butyracea]